MGKRYQPPPPKRYITTQGSALIDGSSGRDDRFPYKKTIVINTAATRTSYKGARGERYSHQIQVFEHDGSTICDQRNLNKKKLELTANQFAGQGFELLFPCPLTSSGVQKGVKKAVGCPVR